MQLSKLLKFQKQIEFTYDWFYFSQLIDNLTAK